MYVVSQKAIEEVSRQWEEPTPTWRGAEFMVEISWLRLQLYFKTAQKQRMYSWIHPATTRQEGYFKLNYTCYLYPRQLFTAFPNFRSARRAQALASHCTTCNLLGLGSCTIGWTRCTLWWPHRRDNGVSPFWQRDTEISTAVWPPISSVLNVAQQRPAYSDAVIPIADATTWKEVS